MKRSEITITDKKEEEIVARLRAETDFKSLRIKRLLDLPDLTRKENSPVKFLVDAITGLPRFAGFDIVSIPKIISVKNNFDVLNTPADHPSRREGDTYYAEKDLVLRTQTTAVWPYYIGNADIRKKLEETGETGALSYGIVFRKDEIDRHHFPAFHQIDGLYLCKREKHVITQEDLVAVLVDVAKSLYGANVEWKVIPDDFPYTHQSIEMDVMHNGNWLEILGAGLVRDVVLENLGLDPKIYNGWAFGLGLDRLAMIKMGIGDIRVLWSEDPRITGQFKSIDSTYKEVSKYPSTIRDISFIVDADVSINNYFEIIREYAGNLIEEVKLLDKYENADKFGAGKVSYTFRIVYCSPERTLTNDEVNAIQEKIRVRTESELKAVLR
jgi:phenylalanyl-tRNA synthetase alpha chain